MEVLFDGCTEVLLEGLIKQDTNKNQEITKVCEALPSLKQKCLREDVCPEGEMKRAFMCRQFLREAMKQLSGKLNAINEDAMIKQIVQSTRAFIESTGDETEAERASVVVRNLLILCENIAQMEQPKGLQLPMGKQPKLHLETGSITKNGIAVFENITGLKIYKRIDRVLASPKTPIPIVSQKQSAETKYRSVFFNVAVMSVLRKEIV